MKPTFYEFFAGGGMARAGLGDDWQCVFANDIDPKKANSYVDNWGDIEFKLGDIHGLTPADLPGIADLAWASFPCQDLSLAGQGRGLNAERSGAFWGFYDAIYGLKLRRRAPALVVIENVAGAVTSNNGRDFAALCEALKSLGYRYGAMMVDAVKFVPQSRPRLFIVAVRSDLDAQSKPLSSDGPSPGWTTASLNAAVNALRPDLKKAWRWWRLPKPPERRQQLADLLEPDPADAPWHGLTETQRLLGMMSPVNRAKVQVASRKGQPIAGTIYKRTRVTDDGARMQRAEVRFDGISGCLRTPGGGSSRQTIIVVNGSSVRTRLLSGREAARLMGLPNSYIMPKNYNEAYHLAGDGLVVPVVRFLAKNLLLSILQSSERESLQLVAAE